MERDREPPVSGSLAKPPRARDEFMLRSDIQNIVNKMLCDDLDKMDDHIIDVSEQTVINALEMCDVDYNKAFVKGAILSALNILLLSIMENFPGTIETFEGAIMQVATASRTLAAMASAIAKNATLIAPIAQFASKTV